MGGAIPMVVDTATRRGASRLLQANLRTEHDLPRVMFGACAELLPEVDAGRVVAAQEWGGAEFGETAAPSIPIDVPASLWAIAPLAVVLGAVGGAVAVLFGV